MKKGKMTKKVAVVMCIYEGDGIPELEQAINSLLNQTYPVDMYLYIDGKVSSQLIEVVASCGASYIYMASKNKGLAIGLNCLLDEVLKNGYEYIARMDADDISESTRIEKQIEFLESNKEIDVLGTYCTEFGAKFAKPIKTVPIYNEEIKKFAIHRCPLIHPTVVFRSNCFSEGIRYPTNHQYSEDLGLWHLLIIAGHRVQNLPDALLHFRIGDNTLNRRMGIRKAIGEYKLRINYIRQIDQVSILNLIKIFAKSMSHLLPNIVVKVMYKYFR